ncbi:helix-turn-helix transcriptional regulator [Listeria monocytogenes]|uniref:helix-turn-helix domain-containing protein n=1 Tax=Listeria innocua TaxID=1642 RepID=UPI001365FC09|nr:helix-turn-helix transcriptional regulator [Listeria innocua]MDF7913082.1 helix-turn-helix transcriptional regulator [Listeria monocytogenes]MDF7921922.1 helix-turn-helix transcriptional regulator [Listeria monocytogenes]MDF7957315.1 helix-turn-helix transcriptional regulator [Listeria monocytogenes]MDF7997002.1 helix-turn-helix transcriptional regulator [Listeria monocytogenes]MDF8011837.1 helix-turn-helix transcriptional regulator [Listeria monocytogenes]
MNTLSKKLEYLRNSKGWSKVEVAKRLGMKASSTYSNWEYGNREPDIDTLKRIADLYGVSVDYLLGRQKNKLVDTIAAHIDPNATEEEMEEILAYIEEKRKEYANEEEIDITDIAAKKDADVAKFVEENPDFKAVAARVMDDEEAVKAVKTFIEYYEQQKKK